MLLKLLFAACHAVVTRALYSLFAASLTLALLFITIAAFLNKAPTLVLLGLTFVLMIVNSLYIHNVSLCMLPPAPKRAAFRFNPMMIISWKRQHLDFFIFICVGMMILAVLIVFFQDSLAYFYWKTVELQAARVQLIGDKAHPTTIGTYSLVIFGSRFSAAAVLILLLVIWIYLCRVGIRIPAHADGYYIRTGEALDLTRSDQFAIAALSLLFLSAGAALADVLKAWTIEDLSEPYKLAAVWTVTYFVIMQFHIGLWVAVYTNVIPPRYHLNRLLY